MNKKMEKTLDNDFFPRLCKLLWQKFSCKLDLLEFETNLEKDLAFDSRDFFELLEDLEDTFNIKLDSNRIDYLLKNGQLNTLKDLVQLVKDSKI
ncbi:MAG: acyl carrier protein [Desulfuromonadales bacterium]|nr:acyl carrier protein [Desulfuromonadales bacterium]